MKTAIPVYRADRSLYGHVNKDRLARLQSAGLVARVVRHRKGHVNRVILFAHAGEPKPVPPGAYLGTRYVVKERLNSGLRCWRFKPLNPEKEDGIVIDGRAAFLQVIQGCLASRGAQCKGVRLTAGSRSQSLRRSLIDHCAIARERPQVLGVGVWAESRQVQVSPGHRRLSAPFSVVLRLRRKFGRLAHIFLNPWCLRAFRSAQGFFMIRTKEAVGVGSVVRIGPFQPHSEAQRRSVIVGCIVGCTGSTV